MVAFVPPSGNDPPFLAAWPMDYMANNTLRDLLNSNSYHVKAESYNYFVFHSAINNNTTTTNNNLLIYHSAF